MIVIKKLLILCVVLVTLSACTMRTAYNYLDWYLAWKIDDYVELTSEQEVLFDKAIENFIAWHRAQELPRYHTMLSKLQSSVKSQDPVTFNQVYGDTRSIWLNAAQEVAPSIILLLDKLSLEQRLELVKNIQTKQSEDHKKWRERAKLSVEKRTEEELEELTETLGELTSEQTKAYLATIETLSSTRELRITSRELWMQKFKSALTEQAEIDQVALFELFTDMSSYRSAEHMAKSQANQEIYLAFLTKQLPTLTAKQQNQVIDTIQDYLDDLDYLIAQKT